MAKAKKTFRKWGGFAALLILLGLYISISFSVVNAEFTCNQAFYDEMVAHFLQTVPPAPAHLDLNGDGIVDLSDYAICLNNWSDGSDSSSHPTPSNGGGDSGSGENQGNNTSQPQRGGMNIQAYCESIGYTGASHGADTYSWVCTKEGSQPSPIDVDSVCRHNYGDALPYAGFTNQNDPGSWYCAAEPQGRPGSGDIGSSVGSSGGSGSNMPLDYGSPTPFSSYNLRINTTSGLNIRSGPGTNYDIIGRAVNGGNFEIINETFPGWYQIRFSGGAGWVSAAYVEVKSPSGNQEPINTYIPPSSEEYCDSDEHSKLPCVAQNVDSVEYYEIASEYTYYETYFSRLNQLRENTNIVIDAAQVALLVIPSDNLAVQIVCGDIDISELNRDIIVDVPSASNIEGTTNVLCMSIDIVEGVVLGANAGSILTMLDIMINADQYGPKLGAVVDEVFLDKVNQWAGNTPLTCWLFPEACVNN